MILLNRNSYWSLRKGFNFIFIEDIVYMENEAERFEYVLNDTGRIWIGSARCHYGRPWNFGQVKYPHFNRLAVENPHLPSSV